MFNNSPIYVHCANSIVFVLSTSFEWCLFLCAYICAFEGYLFGQNGQTYGKLPVCREICSYGCDEKQKITDVIIN